MGMGNDRPRNRFPRVEIKVSRGTVKSTIGRLDQWRQTDRSGLRSRSRLPHPCDPLRQQFLNHLKVDRLDLMGIEVRFLRTPAVFCLTVTGHRHN